jgi:hypothetical protein
MSSYRGKSECLGLSIHEPNLEIRGYYEDTAAGLIQAKNDLRDIASIYRLRGLGDSVHILMIQRIISTLYIPGKTDPDPFNVVFMYSDLEREERQLLADECDSD